MASAPSIAWTSERTLLVEWGERPSVEASLRVGAFLTALGRSPPPGLTDATPAYTSVVLSFDALRVDERRAEHAVRAACAPAAPEPVATGIVVEIPFCAEGDDVAPDLAFVAARAGLAAGDVIDLFASRMFTCAFVGFTPGFPYLIGLPAPLRAPRLDTPRPRVAPGSVAIAGDQTGVYPAATPGGWRIIGRTHARVFDASRERAALVQAGDHVRFLPITRPEFERAAGGAP